MPEGAARAAREGAGNRKVALLPTEFHRLRAAASLFAVSACAAYPHELGWRARDIDAVHENTESDRT